MRRPVAASVLGALLACAGVGPQPDAPPAELAVEIWSGFQQPPSLAPPPPLRVEILLDLTSSMRAHAPGAPPRYLGARESAARLVESLAGDTPLGVRALGLTRGVRCSQATPVAEGAVAALRTRLPGRLRALAPASEGSLAAAFDAVRRDLAGDLEGARIVALTDLDNECGGDLCAAGAALVGAGARLELIVLSNAALPDCFLDFAPSGPPRLAGSSPPADAPRFLVERHNSGRDEAGEVLGRGRADGTPVTVASGAALVTVEMEPPAVIGPMRLSPGTRTRVRVLDFPLLTPRMREWRWDTEPIGTEVVRSAAP